MTPFAVPEDDETSGPAAEDLGHRKKLLEPSSIIFSFGFRPKHN